MSKKTPAGAPTNNLIPSAHTGPGNQVFPHMPALHALHVPHSSAVADVTFGRAVFWKKVPQDLFELRATDLDTGTDCRDLAYGEGQMDCVVFDPPYMHSPGGSAHSRRQNFEQYYGNNRSSSAGKYGKY